MGFIYSIIVKLFPKKRIELLLQSQLFDWDWYRDSYNIKGEKNVVAKHYIRNGKNTVFSPSTLFYTDFYIKRHPIRNPLNLTPLEHYLFFGWRKGFSPTPFFDPKFYLENNADVKKSGKNPFIHFLEYGWKEGRNPNPYFNTMWYLKNNPDVREKNINPLIHYIGVGAKEGRSPSPSFDNNWYKAVYLKGSDINPLGHFLSYGMHKGYQTQPHSHGYNEIEGSNYTSGNPLLKEIRSAHNPGPYFVERTNQLIDWDYKIKFIAFYLPQFHEIPENNEWWGQGFTEWTNVTKGIPRFEGHYQPKLPRDLGFYDLSNVEVIKKQVEIAKQYGIFGFCFHYYWFSGKRLLEKPLDLFLENKSIDFPFCLCWANENWTRRWDGLDKEILIKQDFSHKDLENFMPDIKKYVLDKRYIRLNGRPIIIIYRPQLIPKIKLVLERWKEQAKELKIGNPIWIAVQAFGLEDPNDVGFDVALEFPPHKLAQNVEPVNDHTHLFDKDFDGRIIDTIDLVKKSEYYSSVTDFPLLKGVFPSWDNEARKKGGGTTFVNATPLVFKKWLTSCSEYALESPVFGESLVFINAWNEWAEGAYLEPDQYNGFAYLDVVKSTAKKFNLPKTRTEQSKERKTVQKSNTKFLVVSHDAHRHGAQLNILGFVRTLHQQFGFEVSILLLDGGALESEFRKEGNTFCLHGRAPEKDDDFHSFLFGLELNGFEYAICNTTVSGRVVPSLKKSNFKIISLIHELPSLIREYELQENCKHIAQEANKVIFASEIVKNGFQKFADVPSEKPLILPQGVYAFPLDNLDEIPKGTLREELSLKETDQIVLSVGFADLRKGVDLFVRIADQVIAKNKNIHFVWIGNTHGQIFHWIEHDVALLPVKDNIHFLSFRENISDYIIDADLYLLTSREDPFPTVVLEAMAFGKPVIAFEGSGGIVELNKHGSVLETVPYLDVDQMAKKAEWLLAEPNKDAYDIISEESKMLIEEKFRYDDYCFEVIQQLVPDLKKVSVVVPNYNYAHTLEERLVTIWDQDYPIFETIILDDKSTDNSLEVIDRLSKKYKRTIRLFVNEENSGTPFAQWKKGVEKARGEFVWIAEADDLSKPSFLSELLPFFETPEVGMAYAQSEQIDEKGNFLAPDYLYYTDELDRKKWRQDYIQDGIKEIEEALSIKNTILNVSAVLWRKDRLADILFKEYENIRSFKVAGDWYLYIKFLKNSKISFLAQPLNIHRRHVKSATHELEENTHVQEIKQMHKVIRQNIPNSKTLIKTQGEYSNDIWKHLKNMKKNHNEKT